LLPNTSMQALREVQGRQSKIFLPIMIPPLSLLS
jgi:hypothetical protein